MSEVSRAVYRVSMASVASCLAMRSDSEVCVAAMAMPKTPSRETNPTVSTTMEIMTSMRVNPYWHFRRCGSGLSVLRFIVGSIGTDLRSGPDAILGCVLRSEEHTSEL